MFKILLGVCVTILILGCGGSSDSNDNNEVFSSSVYYFSENNIEQIQAKEGYVVYSGYCADATIYDKNNSVVPHDNIASFWFKRSFLNNDEYSISTQPNGINAGVVFYSTASTVPLRTIPTGDFSLDEKEVGLYQYISDTNKSIIVVDDAYSEAILLDNTFNNIAIKGFGASALTYSMEANKKYFLLLYNSCTHKGNISINIK